jgi:hypothetical protein
MATGDTFAACATIAHRSAAELDAPAVGVPELGELGMPELGVFELGVPVPGMPELGIPELGAPGLEPPELGMFELGMFWLGAPIMPVAAPLDIPCVIGVIMQTKVFMSRSPELGWGAASLGAVCPLPVIAPDVPGVMLSDGPIVVPWAVSAGGSGVACGACAPRWSEPPHPTAAANMARPHRAPTFRMAISSRVTVRWLREPCGDEKASRQRGRWFPLLRTAV